jgi:tetratricopeptide (TPR) repeat protein
MVFSGENAESYYDEGLTASMKGDLGRAVECFEKAVQLDSSMVAAYHQLAKCYVRCGQNKRAANLLQQVVDRKPDQIPPRLDLGYALLSLGSFQDARKQFGYLIARAPDNARAHLGLAKVCFQEGDWTGAVMHAQTALERSGPNFAVLFVLGRAAKLASNAALAEESLDQSDKLLEKSIELQPDQPEGYYLRGEVAMVRDQLPTALEHFRAAEDRAKRNQLYTAFGESFTYVDVLAKQGVCYQRLGNTDRAREIGERILQLQPDHPLAAALKDLA